MNFLCHLAGGTVYLPFKKGVLQFNLDSREKLNKQTFSFNLL